MKRALIAIFTALVTFFAARAFAITAAEYLEQVGCDCTIDDDEEWT